MKMTRTYNKGEWSEAYAFIKLLGDARVYAADENLNINYDKFYPILKVYKNEIERYYETNTDKGIVNIVNSNGSVVDSLKTSEFTNVAEKSVDIIRKGTKGENVKKGKNGTFEVPIMDDFLNKIGIEKVKGSNTEKTDLILEIWDDTLRTKKKLNFSIKSFLGAEPTLMNASQATNFTYKVDGMSDKDFEKLNNITGKHWLKKKFGEIYRENRAGNYEVTWIDQKDKMLYQNLRLIDSNLPKILSDMLFYFYSHGKSGSITLLTEELIKSNPLNLADEEKAIFYKKKVIDYIEAATFGMMPSKRWNDNNEINGGLLTVRNDGKIVYHHILYDYDSLKKYLFKNTKLDTGKTKKHKFGQLYKKNDEIRFKLNLQLRYK